MIMTAGRAGVLHDAPVQRETIDGLPCQALTPVLDYNYVL